VGQVILQNKSKKTKKENNKDRYPDKFCTKESTAETSN